MPYKKELFIAPVIKDFTSRVVLAGEPRTDPAYEAVGYHAATPIIANEVVWTSKAYRLLDYVTAPVGTVRLDKFTYKVMQTGWTLGVREHYLRIFIDGTKVVDRKIYIPGWDKYFDAEESIGQDVSPDASVKVEVEFTDAYDPVPGCHRAFVGVMKIIGNYMSETPPSTGGAVVRVNNAETGAPVEGALCYLLKDRAIVASKKTDSTGTAEFRDVVEGGYTLRVSKSGFYDVEYPLTIQPGQTLLVTVSLAPVPLPWYVEWLYRNWPWLVGGAVAVAGIYVIVKRVTGVSPVYIVRERLRGG
ncbi:MAG: carboxypeptidase-like regulatory domain-containing protein [Desulfurococcaceae archaeon]